MARAMFVQLCFTVALGVTTALLGRNMHDVTSVILFAAGVVATILAAFRVRTIKLRHTADANRRVPQNAATDPTENPPGSIR